MNFITAFFLLLIMQNRSPIGFFDSGYGGLTVLRSVQHQLPLYDYIYLGDNKRAPYGILSKEEVYENTWQGIQALFRQGCELVILACNTASAEALRRIQQSDLLAMPEKRVLGVIRPSAEVVGTYSSSHHITILGTEGTINSNTYVDEFNDHSPTTIVHQQACPNWVPLIESQDYKKEHGKRLIQQEVEEILRRFPQSDVILLGCTHYPIIQSFIESIIPPSIKLISQGEIVAQSLENYLKRHQKLDKRLSKNGKTIYFTTGEPRSFKEHASAIVGIEIEEVHPITIETELK